MKSKSITIYGIYLHRNNVIVFIICQGLFENILEKMTFTHFTRGSIKQLVDSSVSPSTQLDQMQEP